MEIIGGLIKLGGIVYSIIKGSEILLTIVERICLTVERMVDKLNYA